jgi:hypothetical protein
MPIAIVWFLSLGFILVGCSDSKKNNENTDADSSGGGCIVDLSKEASSALPVIFGEKVTGQICPRGDSDFYLIDLPEGMELLDVHVAYPSVVTKVNLKARLFQSDGVTQVANGLASDPTSDGKSALVTTFRVPKAGRYFLQVSDVNDTSTDHINSYILQVAAIGDPDNHESNDTTALAKAPDGQPGFFSYQGDVDVYQVKLVKADSLLQLKIHNPALAKATIEYAITDEAGKELGTGKVTPAVLPLDLTQPVKAAGTLFLSFQQAAGSIPDRRTEAGYIVTTAEVAERDLNEAPVRNDTPATATCLNGASSPCTAVYSNALVTFPMQQGLIGSRGDRDYFLFRATSAPAVVEVTLQAPASTMDLAFDILAPHLASPCQTDTECKVLAGPCKTDDDCEWSHQCIAAASGACTTSTCRQCAGAGLCLPLPDTPVKNACGVTLYSIRDMDGGMSPGTTGSNVLRTAQPVIATGPVYIVVHDQKDDQYDPNVTYSLSVKVAPEPDALDNSADPAARNNFYNPYPLQTTELFPQKARAKDITAQITAGTSVTGFISYASDEDWYRFAHPCAGADCGLVFEWVQPGPSTVRPVFFLRTESLNLHESWTYTGPMPTTAPTTDLFGDGNCTECSFASKKHIAAGSNPYQYFLQVRDAGADDWDYTANGRYEFRLKTLTPGCPASCSERGAELCGCFCKAQNQCPAGPVL